MSQFPMCKVSQIETIQQQYKMIQALGQGSFAVVWKAQQLKPSQDSQKIVAIKCIQVHPIDKEVAYKQAQNLQKVINDHIIKYYHSVYDRSESTLNVIMELCKCSLRKIIGEKIFSRDHLMSFIVQINSAFLELLDKKIMHLDLKPQNILLSNCTEDCYKICDFGCSQIALKSKFSKFNNNIFGTFNYLAPENYLEYGGKITNTSVDIWSFGVILYEMVFKKLPLPIGKDKLIIKSQMSQFFKGNTQKIVYDASGPPQIIQIIKELLKPNPKQRITWPKLKQLLIEKYKVSELLFQNVKNIFSKHFQLLKLFLNVIFMIKTDIQLNPFAFWVINKEALTQLWQILLHLCYIYVMKFKKLYGYKMKEYLPFQSVQHLLFVQKNIALQENALAKHSKNNNKLTSLEDEKKYEELLIEKIQFVKIKMQQYKEFWRSMKNLDCFFMESLKCYEKKKTFFAVADQNTYGNTSQALQMNAGGQ